MMLVVNVNGVAESKIWNWRLFSTQEEFYSQTKNLRVNLSTKLILNLRKYKALSLEFQCILNQSDTYLQ